MARVLAFAVVVVVALVMWEGVVVVVVMKVEMVMACW